MACARKRCTSPGCAWARAWSARSPPKGAILNLAEAAEHPAFAYKPETGEERFHSFAGVPIVRLESPIGVLAVQHAEPRALRRRRDRGAADRRDGAVGDDRRRPAGRRRAAQPAAQRRTAAAAGPQAGRRNGEGRGRLSRAARRRRAYRRRGHRGRARARLFAPFDKMREQIDNMARDAEFGTAGEHQEILETYRMFAYDEGWSRRINEAIDSGLTAEAAIERVQQRTRAADARDRRSAAPGADARSRGPVQPAAADRLGADGHRGADRPCAAMRS